jgi:hypothetical protein
MTKLGNQADFPQESLIVSFTVNAGLRYLQGDPDTLHAVLSLPDLAESTGAKTLLKAILAQSAAPSQVQI